jgi:peptide/nickel transport system substrate-binding protein
MSGALHIGTNIVRLTDAKGNVLDTAYIDRYADSARFAKARSEQELVEAFVASREESLPASKRITTRDLFLDDGFLRKRTADDQPHTRVNARGEPLTLTLLTSNSPETYPIVADLIAKQWAQIGVTVNVVIPDSRRVFEERMLKRDYDIVLFGESLLDNLDSYPYWHSGQIQDRSGEAKNLKVDALNLSQYTSIEADALLTKIRQTRDPALRDRALTQLNALLKKDVPAIFLYSPLSIFGYRDRIGGIAVANLSLHSDRFQTMEQWYVHTRREFKDGKSWWSFVPWLFSGL